MSLNVTGEGIWWGGCCAAETRGSYVSREETQQSMHSNYKESRVVLSLGRTYGEKTHFLNRYISSPHEPADIPVTIICNSEFHSSVLTHYWNKCMVWSDTFSY